MFSKGRQLFGIDVARAAAAKAGSVVLAEGYTDVIALHQAGFGNAVGVMGTALTGEQAREIGGLASVVLLCLDADAAGQQAAVRAASVLPGPAGAEGRRDAGGVGPGGRRGGGGRRRADARAARGRGPVRALPDRADARARAATTRRSPRSPASSARCRRASCAASWSSSPRAASASRPELVESAVRTARPVVPPGGASAAPPAPPTARARRSTAASRPSGPSSRSASRCPSSARRSSRALDLDAVFSSPARPPRRRAAARPPRPLPSSILAEEPDLVGLVAELRRHRRPPRRHPGDARARGAPARPPPPRPRDQRRPDGGEGAIGALATRAPEGARRDPAPPAVRGARASSESRRYSVGPVRSGVAQWQSDRLLTDRLWVRVPPPELPEAAQRGGLRRSRRRGPVRRRR